MKNIRMPTVVGLIKAENAMPQVTAADAGKLATVDSNGKWAAAELEVGQGEVAVDSTLLVSGAAADAKVTGDKVNELKSAIANEGLLLDNAAVDINSSKYWTGGTIGSDGTITSQRNNNNIYTPALLTFPIYWQIKSNSSYGLYIAKYKGGAFVSRTYISSSVKSGSITPDSTFDAYRFMLISSVSGSSYTVEQMVAQFDRLESVRKTTEDSETGSINVLLAPTLADTSFFAKGYYDASGIYYDTGTQGNITSNIIKTPTVLIVPTALMYNICKFSDGAFVSRGSWTAGNGAPITINEAEYKVMLATVGALSDYTVADVVAMIPYFGTLVAYNAAQGGALTSRVEYINRVNCSWTGSKICHYSVDDVYAVLKDLTDNAGTYTSIFDNTTLAALKSIHESTGLCVTLNTFNTHTEVAGYSISNVPENVTFKAEFQANKGWLKFAFHGENDASDYSTDSGISASYDTFVSAIYKLTGDYDCIDTFTRLGYFGGNLANMLAIKDKAHGISGLLCADAANRDSYYLNAAQNDTVQSKGMYVDAANELVFLKTITRTPTNMVSEIEGNLCYQKYIELFSHEYETSWLTTCATMAAWLKEHGYVFAFPSEIIV